MKNEKPFTKKDGRRFGLVVGGAFLALSAILWWREHATAMYITATLGALLVTGGLIVPGMMQPVERAWMKLALAISKITTPIFMGVIFFVVITPAGLLARLFGHRPLVNRRPSAWAVRPPEGRRSDLQRQF